MATENAQAKDIPEADKKNAPDANEGGSVDRGLFNFDSIMRDFYSYSPSEDDDEGRALKRGFQADLVKKFADSQLASSQAARDQQFQMDATGQLADLELRNQSQIQEDTYKYGMAEMAKKFDYEQRMAVDEAGRELKRMSSAGDIQSNLASQQIQGQKDVQKEGLQIGGYEQRRTQEEGLRIGGEEQRETQEAGLRIGAEEQRETDLSRIGAEGTEQRAAIKAKALADEYTIQASGREQRETQKEGLKIGGREQRKTQEEGLRIGGDEQRQTQREGLEIGGDEQRETQKQGLQIGGREQRKTVQTTAEEGRKTMKFGDDIEAGKENRSQARSRALARR